MQYDRANAPTEILARREHHRIATLGRNAIIRDYYKTQALRGDERVTRLLPRKTKRPRRMISAALKILEFLNGILTTRKEISK